MVVYVLPPTECYLILCHLDTRVGSNCHYVPCSVVLSRLISPTQEQVLHKKGDSASTCFSPTFTSNSGDNSRWNHTLQEMFELHILINFTSLIGILKIPIKPGGLSTFSCLVCAVWLRVIILDISYNIDAKVNSVVAIT